MDASEHQPACRATSCLQKIRKPGTEAVRATRASAMHAHFVHVHKYSKRESGRSIHSFSDVCVVSSEHGIMYSEGHIGEGVVDHVKVPLV